MKHKQTANGLLYPRMRRMHACVYITHDFVCINLQISFIYFGNDSERVFYSIYVLHASCSHMVCVTIYPPHVRTGTQHRHSALPQHKIITDKTAQTLHHTWTILIWILLYKYFGCCLCVCYDWALWFQFTHKILRLFKFSAIFCFVVVVVVAVVVAGRSSKVKGSWHMDVKNCERDTDRRR